jgi:hypothetical protein
MSLGLSRVAFACRELEDIARRQALFTHGDGDARHVLLTSRRVPRRDLSGGRLFWILKHTLVARQAILAVEEMAGAEGTIAAIRLDPEIVRVVPRGYRAHQGWRYVVEEEWPADAGPGELLPLALAAELAGLSLL